MVWEVIQQDKIIVWLLIIKRVIDFWGDSKKIKRKEVKYKVVWPSKGNMWISVWEVSQKDRFLAQVHKKEAFSEQ